MSTINNFLSPELTNALGWTLLHSLWQGGAIALLLSLAFIALSRYAANVRYWIGLGGLLLLLISTLATFAYQYEAPRNNETNLITAHHKAITELPPVQMEHETATSFRNHPTDYLNYFDPHLPLFVSIWILGILIFGLKMLGEFAYLQHLKNYRCRLLPRSWQESTHRIAAKMGIKKAVFVKETFRIHSPMVIGFFKPVIFFPLGMINQLSVEQIESIIAHELAHIRRNDYLINLLMAFTEVLLFFNPMVWWINRKIRAEREFSCDDLAIAYTGDTLNFVKSLAQLEEWRMNRISLGMAFGSSPKGVLARVQRIVQPTNRQVVPAKAFLSISMLSICLTALAFQPAAERDSIPMSVTEPELPETITSEISVPTLVLQHEDEEQDEPVLVNTEIDAPESPLSYPILLDTVPDEMETLRKAHETLEKQRRILESEYNQKGRAFEKQMLEMEKQAQEQVFAQQESMQKLEMEMQRQEHARQKAEHELEMKERTLREQHLELEQMEEELQRKHEEIVDTETINAEERLAQTKALQAQQKALLQQENKFREQELMLEKEMHMRMMEAEKAAQEIEHHHFEMEHQLEMQMHKFEMQRQELEQQREVMEAELMIQFDELEKQMETIENKMEDVEQKMREKEDQ